MQARTNILGYDKRLLNPANQGVVKTFGRGISNKDPFETTAMALESRESFEAAMEKSIKCYLTAFDAMGVSPHLRVHLKKALDVSLDVYDRLEIMDSVITQARSQLTCRAGHAIKAKIKSVKEQKI